MDHPAITMEGFADWLQSTMADATPCDSGRCVLAVWLQDLGFVEPQVDGDRINEMSDLGPEEPFSMATPSWCSHVMTCFDTMAGYQLHCAPRTPIPAETYRGPLLALLNDMHDLELSAWPS